MTREELSERLHHLDPGATLALDERVLAQAFGADALSDQLAQTVEAFALEHRCTFSYHEHGRTAPCFEKDDIF
jgi:hypothetical protein